MEPFNSVQAFVDRINAEEQKRRSAEQMTLGKLIEVLEHLPGDRIVQGLGDLDSYRGYYCDLAFEPGVQQTVSELLSVCKDAMGIEFDGYKGGEYLMGEHTPLWVSDYGRVSGMKLMGLQTDTDPIGILTEQEEW